MKGRNNQNKTRRIKEHEQDYANKSKFMDDRRNRVYTIEPKTENQKKFLDALSSKKLIVGVGHAGVGKSFLSCVHAANQYLLGNYQKIVLLRPYVQVGKTAGLLPGSLKEKLWPLMLPMLETLEMVLGTEKFKYMIEHNDIMIEAIENVRGRSYRNAIIIVDESQNITPTEINALVTRLEDDSQIIIIGDSRQHDMKCGETGISFLVNLIRELKIKKPIYLDDDDLDILFQDISCVTFNQDDIVRSGLTKLFCKVFDNR